MYGGGALREVVLTETEQDHSVTKRLGEKKGTKR